MAVFIPNIIDIGSNMLELFENLAGLRFFESQRYRLRNATYSVSQKSSPPKTFCDILTCDEPV